MKNKKFHHSATRIGIMLTTLLAIMLVAGLITACSSSREKTESATSQPDAADAEQSTAQSDTAEAMQSASGNVVSPLYPLSDAQDALADGGYSVSFTADDFVQTDAGYELTVEVYEYDRYDPKDIETLTEGSQIQVCNHLITVKTVGKDPETGCIAINGGMDEGGIELREEDGLYRTVTVNDYPVYYSVGKLTIPVSEEITFEDHADLDKRPDGEVFYLKDLPEALKSYYDSFYCTDTVITVRQEQIVQIIRYWVP